MKNLTKHWKRWRHARKREMIASGMDLATALQWSGREAMCKQDTEALIGREAALRADLAIKLRGDGTYGMYSKVPERLIPPEYYNRAKAWADSPDRSPGRPSA